MRPCSDLAAPVAVVSALHEAGPLSTALVASVALPDKRLEEAREHRLTNRYWISKTGEEGIAISEKDIAGEWTAMELKDKACLRRIE